MNKDFRFGAKKPIKIGKIYFMASQLLDDNYIPVQMYWKNRPEDLERLYEGNVFLDYDDCQSFCNYLNEEANKELEFKEYMKVSTAEMRPYIEGEYLSERVSISDVDRENGSPKEGDMIARNPKDHEDMWLVAEKFFKENYEEV